MPKTGGKSSRRRSDVRTVRVAVLVTALIAVWLPGIAVADGPTIAETTPLPCGQFVDHPAPPFSDSVKVLGKVAFPASPLGLDSPGLAPGSWSWVKQGLLVRAGTKFSITAPEKWRGRLAIGW